MSLERANKFHLTQPIALIAGFAFSVILLLTACGRAEIEPTPTPTRQTLNEITLVFETIEQNDISGTGQYYEDIGPGLMVISSEPDITSLGQLVTDESTTRLQELDYEHSFALIVFQGWKGSGGYEVQIERVTRAGNTINFYAQFHEPGSDDPVTTEITSPYHLIRIQKNGVWDQDFLFQVVVDSTIVASSNHFIP